jgi:hypothetical protein
VRVRAALDAASCDDRRAIEITVSERAGLFPVFERKWDQPIIVAV